ncbi:MAG: ATP-grasp domain-containing protein [Anaerolineae bacterium]|nr:ATP-grasp domain-containing protein [Gemmatimonadaceae bacterium]
MKIVLLHTHDAVVPPADPVLDQLEAALNVAEHHVTRLEVDREVLPLVETLQKVKPDLVVNIAESFDGKSALESNVAALLNLLHLRYTGSSPAGLIMAGDKTLTKKVLNFHEIQTPKFASLYRGALDSAQDLKFPVIVKPPQEDASLGLTAKSVVHDISQLLERIGSIQTEFRSPVLLEEFIDGREYYVAVLGNVDVEALPIIELDFSGFPPDKPKMASWEAKWGDDGAGSGSEFAGTKSIFPDNLSENLTARIKKVAVECFHALRLRDYARIDLRVTDAEEIYVIEVNPNCYLEKASEFASAAAKSGISYDALIARIVELANGRYSR